MSRHLRVLRSVGLVEAEVAAADARLRVYRLRKEPFEALHAWLPRFWDDQLASFKGSLRATVNVVRTIDVRVGSTRAFAIFTEEIGAWYRAGSRGSPGSGSS